VIWRLLAGLMMQLILLRVMVLSVVLASRVVVARVLAEQRVLRPREPRNYLLADPVERRCPSTIVWIIGAILESEGLEGLAESEIA
jgi:hypothetical protein